MAKQGRNQAGKFASKSEKPRSVRTMRLTDTAWMKLGEVAESRGITRADLIEEWSGQVSLERVGQLTFFDARPSEVSHEEEVSLQKVKSTIDQVLSDPAVTRNGKDKGSVRRALEALLKALR